MQTPDSIITKNPGITTVVLGRALPDTDSAGDEREIAAAKHTIAMFEHTTEDSIRVIFGNKTITAMRGRDHGRDRVAVFVAFTGHPITKSIRRMLRRTLKAHAQGDEQARGPRGRRGRRWSGGAVTGQVVVYAGLALACAYAFLRLAVPGPLLVTFGVRAIAFVLAIVFVLAAASAAGVLL